MDTSPLNLENANRVTELTVQVNRYKKTSEISLTYDAAKYFFHFVKLFNDFEEEKTIRTLRSKYLYSAQV